MTRVPFAHAHPSRGRVGPSYLLLSVASAGFHCVCFVRHAEQAIDWYWLKAVFSFPVLHNSPQSAPQLLGEDSTLYTRMHLLKMSLEADNKMS